MAERESAREDGIEAVAICTPNHTHRDIAITFMQNGIDIICDKPIANTLDDAQAMQQMQNDTGLVFAVTHPYIFHPMVRQAKEMIAAGKIGCCRQFTIEYAQEWAGGNSTIDEDQWRKDPAKAGRTSTTGDIGTHAFQLLEYVCSDTVGRLRADFHVCGPARELEDTAFFNLQMAGGAPGSMWITQVAAGEYCGLRFRIYGDKGSVSWDQEHPEQLRFATFDHAEQIIHRGQGSGMMPGAESMTTLPRGHGETLSDAWANMYNDIADTVAARRTTSSSQVSSHLPGIVDGVRGIRFIHAAADSNDAGGQWVTLE
jgi:predicted dehydrogenase